MTITVKPCEDPRFRAGQRWSYRTRPGDVRSTALVVAVDEYVGGVVLNLFLSDIERGPGLEPLCVLAPARRAEVESSTLALLDERHDVSAHADSVDEWRRLVEAGTAGVFTMELSRVAEWIASSSR
jgi:hypothetical protein